MAVTRQGGIRRPMYQDNNAPRGYGQQSGASAYLDREANNVADALTGGGAYEREPQRYGEPDGPVSHTQEEDEAAQRPDRWGRSPGHPHYGQDPRTVGMSTGSAQGGAESLYGGDKAIQSGDIKPGAMDNLRGLLGENPENEDGSFSDTQLARISGTRQGSAGGVMAPEEEQFSYEVAGQQAPSGADAPPASGGMPQGSMWSEDYRYLGGEGAPDVMNLATGDMSRVRGFATNEWGPGGDPNYDEDSIKNTFGKIASRYDPTQPGATRMLMADPEFQALFPNARLVEHPKADQIDFGDGNPVDVLINAVEGGAGEAWAFQTGGGAIAGGGDAAFGGAPANSGGPSPNAIQGALVGPTVNPNDSAIQKLLQQILLGNPEGQQMYNAYQEFI